MASDKEISLFYDSGLRFQCQMCRYCCSAEPGYVYLSEEEIQGIAQYLSLPIDQFMKIYCRAVDFGDSWMISLREKADYDCIFLSEKGCGIYPVRPKQCMNYPFWPSIMESEENWKEEAMHCPGIGQGDIILGDEIRRRLEDQADPAVIPKIGD